MRRKDICQMNYSRFSTKRKALILIAILAVLIGAWRWGGQAVRARAEEETTIDCWVLCKPGDYVNLRMWASKSAEIVGYLECGDRFQTDGKTKDGFIHVLDAGDCDCWIYSGYVVTEEPKPVFQVYVCVAKNRVACRRWVDGPQIQGTGWLRNGSTVDVFYVAGDWAITSRGYIRAEWLEVDP